jgi:hypothetical protein
VVVEEGEHAPVPVDPTVGSAGELQQVRLARVADELDLTAEAKEGRVQLLGLARGTPEVGVALQEQHRRGRAGDVRER